MSWLYVEKWAILFEIKLLQKITEKRAGLNFYNKYLLFNNNFADMFYSLISFTC